MEYAPTCAGHDIMNMEMEEGSAYIHKGIFGKGSPISGTPDFKNYHRKKASPDIRACNPDFSIVTQEVPSTD